MRSNSKGLNLFMALCLVAIGVKADIHLTEDQGVFGPVVDPDADPNSRFSSVHLIRVRLGRKVSIRFTAFDLDSDDGDMVTIRDGRKSQLYHIYTRGKDGRIRMRIDDLSGAGQESPDTAVSELVQFDAATKRVFVTYYTSKSRRKWGYRAEYETYPETACLISELDVRDTEPRCEGYRIAPVATRCNHTLRCPENYEQRGVAVCNESTWIDNVVCLPKSQLVHQCEFDETGITNDCPFNIEEVARYYALADDSGMVNVDAEDGFGRSLQARLRPYCKDNICQKVNQGFVYNCDRHLGLQQLFYFRACKLCQLLFCGGMYQLVAVG